MKLEEKKEANCLLSRFDDFVSSISKDNKVAVLHHTDPDGVCSGVLAAKMVERIRKKKVDLHYNQKGTEHSITKETFELLKEKKIDVLIVTDMSPDENSAMIKSIERFARIIILDHHTLVNDVNSKKTVLIKPQMLYEKIESSMYCASKLVFDLAGRLVDMSDLDWIAGIGVIGDCTAKHWKGFLDSVFKKYNISKKSDWFDTSLGRVCVHLSSSEAFAFKNIKHNFNVVYNSSRYQDVVKDDKIKQAYNAVQSEFNYWVDNVDNLGEHYPELDTIVYFLQPKFNIKSQISTVLALKKPHKTLITLTEKDDKIFFSGRRNDFKIAVNELFIKSIEGIKGASAGGHKPAAGGKIPKEAFSEFKRNLLNNLKKFVANQ